MSQNIDQLEPQLLWKSFEKLNAVPRPSKKEERVIEFMLNYGKTLKLETKRDETGNVLIKKPATEGMTNRKKLILQSHLDMVHQKNNDTVFDFDQEGIRMYIDGDWVKAEGTTLGADNGIGVATIMALLESDDISHPAIEALFTIDEETGMTGAFGLEAGFLEGDILLNLDTEDDDELTIGCAGGVNVNATKAYQESELPRDYKSLSVLINGLSGGHSGMDIIKGLGNSNKLLNRLLFQVSEVCDIRIIKIEGGGLRNAIPRESVAEFAVPANKFEHVKQVVASFELEVKSEHKLTDPNISLLFKEIDTSSNAANSEFSKKVVQAIYAVPNGIYRMSSSISGMVQTSNNLAQVKMANGALECLCLCRSSVDTEKNDEVRAIGSAFSIIDAEVEIDGDYPGWTPQPQSDIVELMNKLYQELFDEKPHVMACHAGLECGIIGTNYPKLDMVSFGPNIRGAHSPDEKVQISSVQKYWNFLIETLKRIPEAS